MLDIHSHAQHYAETAQHNLQIISALTRPDVQAALAKPPDATSLTARAGYSGDVLLVAHVYLDDDPALADLATEVDEGSYRLEVEQPLLTTEAVTVQARIVGRAPLSPSEKTLLRDLGKLVDQTCTYTTLACSR